MENLGISKEILFWTFTWFLILLLMILAFILIGVSAFG